MVRVHVFVSVFNANSPDAKRLDSENLGFELHK